MELREQTIKEMVRLLSEEQVITDENVIIENEGSDRPQLREGIWT
ncbi:MAG: hypothetical protein ACLTBD_07990 [Clostridia bacterium]